jgi:hypothetical protein
VRRDISIRFSHALPLFLAAVAAPQGLPGLQWSFVAIC